MPVTIKNNPEDAGGVSNCIVITIPARGETGWADLVRAAFKKISQHDHTGNENGAQLGVASLQDGAVTKAKINANVAGEGLTKDATSGALNVKIDDVTIEREAATNTLRLKDDGVSAAKLNADVAGLGLVQNGVDESLEVNVDDSTLEIDSDVVRVKDLGIVTAKLADAAITTVKLLDSSVTTDKIADDAVTAAKIPFISDTVATDAVQNDTLVWNATTGQFEPEAGGGGGGASGINHIEESDAESTLATWSASFSSDFNVTADTSNILRGLKSFKLRKAAKVVASPYVEVSFSIPNADKAKKHLISFDYDASDANYSDDDIRLSIIQGASTEIRINGEDLKAGKGTHFATFQTDHTETSYKLRFTYRNTTDANLVDVFLDTVKVSPIGITEAVSGQDVVLNVKGAASPGSHTTNGGWETVPFGDLSVDTVGGWDATNNRYTIPETGYYDITGAVRTGTSSGVGLISISIDGVVVSPSNDSDVTTWTNTAQGFDITFTAFYLEKGQTVEIKFYQNTGGNLAYGITGTYFQLAKRPSLALPETVGSGRDIVCNLQGLSSAKVVNNAADTLIDNWNTPAIDTAGGWDAVNQYYVIPETGYYDIDFSVLLTNDANSDLGRVIVMIKQGSNFLKFSGVRTSGVDYNYGDVSKTAAYLEKGQTISFLVRQDQLTSQGAEQNDVAANAIYTNASIAKRQSAQVALESETVAFTGDTNGAGQTITNDSLTVINFDNIDYDSHNSFASGVYTVPSTGIYNIHSAVTFSATSEFDIGEYMLIGIEVDGVRKRTANWKEADVTDSDSKLYSLQVTGLISLTKGQEVTIIVYQNSGTNRTLQGSNHHNHLGINKIK